MCAKGQHMSDHPAVGEDPGRLEDDVDECLVQAVIADDFTDALQELGPALRKSGANASNAGPLLGREVVLDARCRCVPLSY